MSAPEVPAEFARLYDAARRVREHAYAPYSGFKVGAAVEAPSGAIFSGANVENASYGATVCAERAAVAALIAAGERAVLRVAVYSEGAELGMPCGVCRQVLFEHGPDAKVLVAGPSLSRLVGLRELLPEPFVFRAPGGAA